MTKPRAQYPERDYTEPKPELSESAKKKLAALVRKYDREMIAEAARTIPTHGPGHPEKDWEDPSHHYNVAWCLDTWAEQYRKEKHAAPMKAAFWDMFELLYSPEELRREEQLRRKRRKEGKQLPKSLFERFAKNYEKKLYKGRRFVRADLEAERMKRIQKARK